MLLMVVGSVILKMCTFLSLKFEFDIVDVFLSCYKISLVCLFLSHHSQQSVNKYKLYGQYSLDNVIINNCEP